MLEALTKLFENDAISEELRAEVEDAWNARVTENRQAVTAELREEFAQKYEHDKQTMVEAIDQMLSEGLASEIAEFSEDRKQLSEAKAKYAVAMRENADLLKGFVVDQLKTEIAELRADKRAMQENHAKLEEFIVENMQQFVHLWPMIQLMLAPSLARPGDIDDDDQTSGPNFDEFKP